MTSRKVREFLRSHVLGLVAIFIALTGTAVAGQQSGDDGGPKASAGAVTNAKFKKLKQRVAALEQAGPSGRAGGSLTGTYPNPRLAAGAVGSAQVVDGSVGAADLKGTYTAVSAGETAGQFVRTTETASCGSDRLLGGGYAWSQPIAAVSTGVSAPGGVGGMANPNEWVVNSSNDQLSNTLFAWAVCLRL